MGPVVLMLSESIPCEVRTSSPRGGLLRSHDLQCSSTSFPAFWKPNIDRHTVLCILALSWAIV